MLSGFHGRATARAVCLLVLLVFAPFAARSQAAYFSGEWQTFWRNGSAVLNISQEGDRVTGTYQPDDGTVVGDVAGRVLRGTWEQPGASGSFVFALSEDGQVLTGRFENGEYWNGFRKDIESGSAAWRLGNAAPRETLRSLLLVANAAIYSGDSGALRQLDNLVAFAGPETTARNKAARRTMMFDILDMSTLRIMDVPLVPDMPGEDFVSFEIGPAGIPDKTKIEFRQNSFGRWRLVLPSAEVLAFERTRLLAALGHGSMAELKRARADTPRAVMRDFLQGANSWHEGGRKRALAVMDLSHIPSRLHALEGPVYADFLKRILDRVAYVIWQEIPDDPNRSVPFVYFQHPIGDITIARVAESPAEDGLPADRWKFTSATLVSAPALLEAMQELPTIKGLEEAEALSPYFRLRESVRAAAPFLVADWGFLELWQWLGVAGAFAAAVIGLRAIAAAFRGISSLHPGWENLARMGVPTGLLFAAGILSWTVMQIGLTQMGLPVIGTLAGTALIVAIAFFIYSLASLIGGWFLARAEETSSYVDEIAASLGTGLVKLLIVAAAVIGVADVVGLPYEGVLTGLGVGGIAIAFAARDTVSNMIGGGILMADRPFHRGDLIELDGTLASVEHVGLRSTRLRSLDDTLLNVPNAHLSDRTIANWGKRRRRKVVLGIGLTYDTPRERLDRFVTRLRGVMLDQPRMDRDDLYVGLKGFGASSIDIEIMCYLKVFGYAAQVEAQHKIIMNIIELAEEVGVEFAFPTRTVHVTGVERAPHPVSSPDMTGNPATESAPPIASRGV